MRVSAMIADYFDGIKTYPSLTKNVSMSRPIRRIHFRVRHSSIRRGLPSVDDDEIKIADIDHEPERLPCDEYRVSAVQRLDPQEATAADREEPEFQPDHARARTLPRHPLQH